MNNNINIKRKEKVYLQLEKLTQEIDGNSIFKKRQIGFDATMIGENLDINRPNTSRELNELINEKKVFKIKGKPVYYLHKATMERKLGVILDKNTFEDINELKSYLKIQLNQEINESQMKQEQENDVFSKYIGADSSLKTQIEQAKAAILYPPNGLHTLITGSTGVGKTTFAEVMYKYGIETKILNKSTPFIIFNCADYADNSQLLLSQLFGHAKGSFTGADTAKDGLVKRANNGILFLDEIHRLPPEGQEMMFLIMDKGIYRKLGETEHYEKVNLRIIAATTEDPNVAILSTFLRRIPVTIKLPDLCDRTLQERMDFIYGFFSEESKRINIPIKVKQEVIKILVIYECNGNIGQLRSNIQLICAKAFLEYIRFKQDIIIVKLSQLSQDVKDGIFRISEYRKNITQNFDNSLVEDVTFNYSKENEVNENAIISNDENTSTENFYEIIEKSWIKLLQNNLPENQVIIELNNQIDSYFNRLFSKIKPKSVYYSKEAIAKVVDLKIVDTIEKVLNESKLFSKHYDKKILYGLALHMNALIQRINNGNVNYFKNKYEIENNHNEEFQVATKLRNELENKIFIKIPDDEIAYLTMFLYAVKDVDINKNIGIIVIAHGENTATSMAKVANQLLDTEHACGIDMPLTANVKDIYEKVKSKVKLLNCGKGVLLLVDMGSLVSFSQMITEETGIKTTTIDMVSTLIVIEATRKSLFLTDMDIDVLTEDIRKIKSEYYNNKNTHTIIKLNHNKTSDYFKNNTLRILEETLTFLDCNKAYSIFNQILSEISKEMQIIVDESLRIKFIFHCSSMIERVLKNDPLEYSQTSSIVQNNLKSLNLIKEKFIYVEEAFGVNIPDTEYVFIFNIFETLMKQI